MDKTKNKKKKLKNQKQSKAFDDKLSEELYELLESLTHSGKLNPCPEQFKRVKNICKQSDKYVHETFIIIMEHLHEEHAEVRLSALKICDEIFRRSHCFREQVVDNLEKIVNLTTENLPEPYKVARELKILALKSIDGWNSNFKEKYQKLAFCYNYLRDVKKVDFNSFEIFDDETRLRREENQRRLENINKHRIKKALDEIKDKGADIEAALTSLTNCINLLLPHPEDFFIKDEDVKDEEQATPMILPRSELSTQQSKDEMDEDESDDASQDAALREIGLLGYNHSIQVEFTPSAEVLIEETSENKDIIDNGRENARLIKNKYLPSVKAWLEVLSKSSVHREDYRRMVTLHGELEDVMFKFSRLTFTSADDTSSDDSDLEEVPGLPETKPASQLSDPTTWTITSSQTDGDPSAAPTPVTVSQPQPSTSEASTSAVSERKKKLLAVAPKLPFDVDLYHWEDEKLPVPTMVSSSTEGHRFWLGAESCMDELPVPEGSAALRTRVIEFSGSFQEVKHSCRVRLPSGKLCPRRDRFKCPFHGEIVPRDEKGECVNAKDRIRLQAEAEKRQQERPDWQHPSLLAELKKTTGMDLKMPEKGKRKKRKKEHSGLTDLKETQNTATKRLEKKIFKKSAMRRVASAMDRIDRHKFKDKFGDQFQYFYNS